MNQPRPGAELWTVLLAGGDGTRLQSLTTRIEGDALASGAGGQASRVYESRHPRRPKSSRRI